MSFNLFLFIKAPLFTIFNCERSSSGSPNVYVSIRILPL